MEYLKELIEKEQLSSPKDLAGKFVCNERTMCYIINHLRYCFINQIF